MNDCTTEAIQNTEYWECEDDEDDKLNITVLDKINMCKLYLTYLISLNDTKYIYTIHKIIKYHAWLKN